MATHEFTPWPKTSRLFRNITITEKLDGSNEAIHISAGYEVSYPSSFELKPGEVIVDGRLWRVSAQSRSRMITPGKTTDNYGFAAWVYENAAELVEILGEGVHFGEWWGRGIQRGYGLSAKRFSVFNTDRWHKNDGDGTSKALRAEQSSILDQIDAVPVLYQGTFSEDRITSSLRELKQEGSYAAPGFMNPEGICVYHSQSKTVYKVTLDNNDAGKWEITA